MGENGWEDREWEGRWEKMEGRREGVGREEGGPPAGRAVASTGNTLAASTGAFALMELNGIGSRAITSAWEIFWESFVQM